jgi:uncharacterized protein YbbC (DUF1343 family)
MSQLVTGLERFVNEGPACAGLPRGARLALLAHAASVDGRARHALDALTASKSCRLVRLFAPEHGLWGHEQDMEPVEGSTEPRSGLEIISLYGSDAASLKPRKADLGGIDAVVVDLQDIGARYYTYLYTLSYVMEAAGDSGIAVVVLDRPNPIGGSAVEGPVLDPALASFVGRYPIAVRHGMTAGELALMFNDHFGIGCDLRVVEMDGWKRDSYFDETGLPWVPPSPNVPSPGTALVYPGACLVEGTNLSEGRGTTLPFEQIGAPWIDGPALEERLRTEGLEGVTFRAASFRPMFQKHSGLPCNGIQVIVTARAAFRPIETYIAIIREARRQNPGRFSWRTDAYEFESDRLAIDLLLGREDLRTEIEAGAGIDSMVRSWKSDLEAFEKLRSGFIIYN